MAECLFGIDKLETGMTSDIAVMVLKITNKVKKKNKPYLVFDCCCIKTGTDFKVFDWIILFENGLN